MRIRTSVVAALFLLGAATPKPARAQDFDPTGTWAGDFTCETQIDGTPGKEIFHEQVIKISPGNGGFVMELSGPGLTATLHYRGTFTPDANNPSERGAGTFVECHTNTANPGPYNEILAARFSGDAKRAELNGTSVYNQLPDGFQAGVCHWKFKRTSTEDPGAEGCLL